MSLFLGAKGTLFLQNTFKMKRFPLISFLLLAFILTFSTSSCSKKTGCPINDEQSGVVIDKKGRTVKTKTKTHLFDPKKQKKREKN